MKRCPECRRDYYDDSLFYCLDDGNVLLHGPSGTRSGEVDGERPSFSDAPTMFVPYDQQTEAFNAATLVLPAGDSLSLASDSIAVLPFANIGADPENDYLCEGLAEELINGLSKIEDLRVAARTSAFSFRGTNTPITVIGRSLGVQKILEGSIRRSGDRVRVTVSLVGAGDGFQIWSETYDRKFCDIFAIEDEITLAVVELLKIKVLGDRRAAIVKRYTNNADAYQLYLKGRYHFNKFDVDGCSRAIEFFEQTLALEPNYAPAYAGIAEACGMQWYISMYAEPELVAREREAVGRAIELEPGLAESYRSRALLRCYVDWDLKGAADDYDKTLELNPNDVLAHAWYALLLAAIGENERSIHLAQRARILDPLSVNVALMAGWAFWFSEVYDEALTSANSALEIDPNSFENLRLKGNSLWGVGDVTGAAEVLERSAALGARPLALVSLCLIQDKTGDSEASAKTLERLIELHESGNAPAGCVGNCLIGLGLAERGLEWLEKGIDGREGEMLFIRAYPAWLNPLYDDPRYTALFQKVGLPDRSKRIF